MTLDLHHHTSYYYTPKTLLLEYLCCGWFLLDAYIHTYIQQQQRTLHGLPYVHCGTLAGIAEICWKDSFDSCYSFCAYSYNFVSLFVSESLLRQVVV